MRLKTLTPVKIQEKSDNFTNTAAYWVAVVELYIFIAQLSQLNWRQ